MHVFKSYMQMVEWYQRALEKEAEENPLQRPLLQPMLSAVWKPLRWYREGHLLTGSLEIECLYGVYILRIVCERVELRDGRDAWWGIWSMHRYPFTPASEDRVNDEAWWSIFRSIFMPSCMWEEDRRDEKNKKRILWPGYGGQGYDPGVSKHVEEVLGHKLEGLSTPIPLSKGVALKLYAHPDVLPAVHIDHRAFSAHETEKMIAALRRGKDLQELYTRMMSDTASWSVR